MRRSWFHRNSSKARRRVSRKIYLSLEEVGKEISNIEQGISKAEGDRTSKFDIPCSIFEIKLFFFLQTKSAGSASLVIGLMRLIELEALVGEFGRGFLNVLYPCIFLERRIDFRGEVRDDRQQN